MGIIGKVKRLIKGRPQLVYLHIPKTGGTYLRNCEGDGDSIISPMITIGHNYVGDSKDVKNPIYDPHDLLRLHDITLVGSLADKFVFTTVRNPFSWFASYAAHAGGWNPKYCDPTHYDYEASNRGFDYLLKTIAGRDTPWPNRRFIHCQLFTNRGEFVPHWICRQESLDADLKKLAAFADVTYSPRPRQRVGGAASYRELFNDELVELVYETWHDELRFLGYDFEGATEGATKMSCLIAEEFRSSVQYSYDTNVLSM